MAGATNFDWNSFISTLGELSEKLNLGSFGPNDPPYAERALQSVENLQFVLRRMASNG